jgi:hypothetical protein
MDNGRFIYQVIRIVCIILCVQFTDEPFTVKVCGLTAPTVSLAVLDTHLHPHVLQGQEGMARQVFSM